jgi:hypothetical protein
MALLVDAEYGSATYVEVQRPARFQVRVSTTGLLMREVGLGARDPEASDRAEGDPDGGAR